MKMCYWLLPKIISLNWLFYRSLSQPSVQDHWSASLLCSRYWLYKSVCCVSLLHLTLWSAAWHTWTSREMAGIFISFYPISHCLNLRMNEWTIAQIIHFAWIIHGAQKASANGSWQPVLSNNKGRESLAGPPECWQWKKAEAFLLLVSPKMSKLAKPEEKASAFTL